MAGIVIENVCKTFSTKDGKVEALKNISLSIESGDIYGIIGMSGAGKSTLVRCMNFLEQPSEGRVLIDGKSLGDFSEKELRKQRESIGMIFQHFNLLMQKSVLENVCFPLYIQGKKKQEARKRAEELLEIVGLKDKKKAYPSQLSGGQKQRVAVARALITEPRLILADEPTGALDSKAASLLLSMFGEINEAGQTILMVTHSAQAASHASRVLFIKDGEVFHQIYRGGKTRQEMYQMISDTLTILTTGGENHA